MRLATLQYLRKLKVAIGIASSQGGFPATDFSNLRCVFSIRRGDYQTPNACDLRIFNASKNTANSMFSAFAAGVQDQAFQQEFPLIAATGTNPDGTPAVDQSATGVLVIQAGYEGNCGIVFTGNIKRVRLGRLDAKDSYIDITAADGDRFYNYSFMAQSLAAGSRPADDVQAFLQYQAAGAAISQGYTPELSTNGRVRGQVFYGMIRDELRDFAKQNDVLWSIQDGALTLIPKASFVPGEVLTISPQTGLIGVPEQTQNGIIMRVLLNPSIKIGQRVFLQSNAINQYRYGLDLQSQTVNPMLSRSIKTSADGTYYVMKADHVGDNRGNDWYTELTCLAVDASIPINLAPQAAILPSAASIAQY
jgi:hypothetical protein